MTMFLKTIRMSVVMLLCFAANAHGMETNKQKQARLAKEYTEQALANHEYNETNGFLSWPKELVTHVLYHTCDQTKNGNDCMAIYYSIARFVQLQRVCKQLKEVYLTDICIGKFCKNYSQKSKELALDSLMSTYINSRYSREWKIPLAIPIYADANPHNPSLLNTAARTNNIEFAQTLFACGVNANNVKKSESPPFFLVNTIDMAELFVKNKADIHILDRSERNVNVLWTIVENSYPAELMDFYLTHQVDATMLDKNGACLLHKLITANDPALHKVDAANVIKKAEHLLKYIGNMINHKNYANKTPLDVAKECLIYAKKMNKNTTVLEKIIALLKKHNALTTDQLVKRDAKKENCIIC